MNNIGNVPIEGADKQIIDARISNIASKIKSSGAALAHGKFHPGWFVPEKVNVTLSNLTSEPSFANHGVIGIERFVKSGIPELQKVIHYAWRYRDDKTNSRDVRSFGGNAIYLLRANYDNGMTELVAATHMPDQLGIENRKQGVPMGVEFYFSLPSADSIELMELLQGGKSNLMRVLSSLYPNIDTMILTDDPVVSVDYRPEELSDVPGAAEKLRQALIAADL